MKGYFFAYFLTSGFAGKIVKCNNVISVSSIFGKKSESFFSFWKKMESGPKIGFTGEFLCSNRSFFLWSKIGLQAAVRNYRVGKWMRWRKQKNLMMSDIE